MTGLGELKNRNTRIAFEDERDGRIRVRGLPVLVNLVTTTACNLRCIMCAHGAGMIPVIPMDEDVYRAVVTSLFPTAQTIELTTVGEPLMSPNLPRILADLKRYEVRLDLVSNGTLLKEQKLLWALVERAGTFTFSIDGATRETYDEIRLGASFDDVMENIRRFNRLRLAIHRSMRPRLAFNYVLMKRTIAELPAFIDLAARFRADVVSCVHLLDYVPGSKGESLDSLRPLTNHYLGIAIEKARRHGLVLHRPAFFVLTEDERTLFRAPEEPLPEPDPSLLARLDRDAAGMEPGGSDPARWHDPLPGLLGRPRCHFLWKRTYIGPRGEVFTCSLANAGIIGNVRERPFEAIWNGHAYTEMRRRVYSDSPHPQCKDCYLIAKSGSIPRSALSEAVKRSEAVPTLV